MPPRDPAKADGAREPQREDTDFADGHYLSQEKFEDLLKATELMQHFIARVEQVPSGPKHNVIFEYSGKYEDLSVSPASITRLLDKRIERMFKNRKIKRNWSEEDLQILAWVVAHHAILAGITSVQAFGPDDWDFVARLIPGATGESCMFRVLALKKFKLAEQKWKERESLLLAEIVGKNYGVDWKVAAQQLFKRNHDPEKIYRNPKQCKEHWTCYLNPSLRKGPWDLEEDIQLLQFVSNNNGKRKWADMAKIFQGRTENALKNRYALILEKDKNHSLYHTELEQVEGALKMLIASRPHTDGQAPLLSPPRPPVIEEIYEEESRQAMSHKDESRERNNAATDRSEHGTDNKPIEASPSNFQVSGQGMYSCLYAGNTPFFMMFGNGHNRYI